MTSSRRILLLLASAVVLVPIVAGCAPERQTMPRIVIAPGLKERLAWMDRVRLHDEGRVQRTNALNDQEENDEAADMNNGATRVTNDEAVEEVEAAGLEPADHPTAPRTAPR